MNQSGIIITQAGVSVPYAADYQMVFNSNWPSLQIAFEKRIDIANGKSLTIPHKLGFPPLVMAWAIIGDVNLGRIFAPSGNLAGPQTDVSLSFDSVNIYLTNNGIYNPVTYTVSIKCYNVDISRAIDYTLPQPPIVKTAYDPTTGIKVSKYQKSIGSKDLRDFILHSRAQSPAVLSIVTRHTQDPSAPFTGNTIQYKNPVGYTPWVLAFYNGPDANLPYVPLAPGSQQSGYAFSLIGRYGQLRKASGIPHGSLVVLRDPLTIPENVNVTYG